MLKNGLMFNGLIGFFMVSVQHTLYLKFYKLLDQGKIQIYVKLINWYMHAGNSKGIIYLEIKKPFIRGGGDTEKTGHQNYKHMRSLKNVCKALGNRSCNLNFCELYF
jgi:hypothetical protein